MILLAVAGIAASAPAAAQDNAAPDHLAALKNCQSVAENSARLACYDAAVGTMVAASDQGNLRIVDQEEVTQTRRRLFGLNLPKLKILGGDQGELETLVTTVTSAHQINGKTWAFVTEEGSAWRINNAPMRFTGPKPGQSVEFKRAAMGTFFVRINGQMGVKGVRVD